MRKSQLRALTILLCIAALVGCDGGGDDAAAAKNTYRVNPDTMRVVIQELGVVESTRTVNVNSPFRGRIITIVDSGQMVQEGDIVAVLDTETLSDELDERMESLRDTKKDLESAIEQLRMDTRSNILDVSSAGAQLDLARVQLEDVNRNLAELELLQEKRIATDEEVRSADVNRRISEIDTFGRDMDFRAQQSGSTSAELGNRTTIERHGLSGEQLIRRIRETEEQLQQAQIPSPVTGMFLRKGNWNWQLRRNVDVQPGEEIRAGEVLGRVPDLTSLIVKSQIPESEMIRVKVGVPAELYFEALSGLTLPGKVTMVSPVAIERERSPGGQAGGSSEVSTGEKVFEIEVEPDTADARVRPGLTARVTIIVDEQNDVLTVPIEAISMRKGEHYVSLREGKGTIERPVRLGRTDGSRVVVEEGLGQGDEVVLR